MRNPRLQDSADAGSGVSTAAASRKRTGFLTVLRWKQIEHQLLVGKHWKEEECKCDLNPPLFYRGLGEKSDLKHNQLGIIVIHLSC